MGDYKFTHVGIGGATDITQLVTGEARDSRTGELDEERTDWDKWIDWWDRVDKALSKKYTKETNK